MNDIAILERQRRHGVSAAAVIAAASLALLAAACSRSPSSTRSPSPVGATSPPSAVAFSACMRSHGVPHWPDPTTDTQGRPGFAISVSSDGFDPHSAQIRAKADECEHVMHPDIGVPLGVSR
jgi:hypothetical protein